MTFGVHYYDKQNREVTGTQFYKTACEERDVQIAALQEQVQKLTEERDSATLQFDYMQDQINFHSEKAQQLAAENLNRQHLLDMIGETGNANFGKTRIETPATNEVIREIGAKAVDSMRNIFIDRVEKELGPNDEVPGLIKAANMCVSVAETLRAGEQP